MINREFASYLENAVKDIDKYIFDNLLTSTTELSPKLVEAVRYSTLAGGKRIRPFLCIAVAEAYAYDRETLMAAACAIELIHCYSLIHDDLPAMDNDDYRRGKPTNHKVYGEAVAILAGDTLLTTAFEWLTKLDKEKVEPEKIVKIINEVAKAAGSMGMIGGQMLDLEGENLKANLEYLEATHKAKTGALLTLPVTLAGILADIENDEMKYLVRFANKLGLLFQIVDDILDVEGDSKLLGKKVGSDAALGKATYPAILGIEKAKTYCETVYNEAIDSLNSLNCKTAMLKALTDYLYLRKT